MAKQHQILFGGGRTDFSQPFLPKAGAIHTTNAGDKSLGEGMSHEGPQTVGLGCSTLLGYIGLCGTTLDYALA